MSRLRATTGRALRALTRVFAVAAVVAMQVMLVGGGPGCPLPTGAASPSRETATMAGMRMGAGATGVHDVVSARARDGGSAPDRTPCDDAASKGCTTMAPCLFAMSLHSPAGSSVGRPSATRIGTLTLALSSITTAPELPPPRA